MKLTDTIKKFFRRKAATQTHQQKGQGVEPVPLRIEGTKPAPLTPEPDDAELAAQALLENMANPHPASPREGEKEAPPSGDERGASYYHALANRIRTARSAEARLTMRLLASVEEQLAEPTALYKGQWGDTERKLYRAMDVAEREGGELHRRWQHCLAEVLVRQMEEEERENEEADAALTRQPNIPSTHQPEETTII